MSATPTDPNVRVVAQTPAAPVVTEEVVETATKIVRAKKFVSKSLKSIGPPAIAGVASALVVNAVRNRESRDDNDFVVDSDTDTSE